MNILGKYYVYKREGKHYRERACVRACNILTEDGNAHQILMEPQMKLLQ